MHVAAVIATVIVLASLPSFAKKPSRLPFAEADDHVTHGTYRNRAGETVHSPTATKSGKPPAGASAQCRDGTYSFSRSRSGTCSGHGGVAQWL